MESERFEPVRFQQRPDVLVLVLESFRADNLEAEVDGKPVTPNLRELVRNGAVTGPAYSHNGYTVESLAHLFTGSLTLTVATSLIDDFADNNYLTACVSGEDESFGDLVRKTRLGRVEHFVDARDDVPERTSAFTTPGSLAVPWTVVTRNIEEFLASQEGRNRPVFLYANYQDCHFPYDHRAMESIVESHPIPRSEICASNRKWVERTYRNAAANVDRAIGRIMAAWKRHRGSLPAFVILGDHGESLYDGRMLGHGVSLTPEQTRILFLVGGLETEVVFPFGLANVRSLLRSALSRPTRLTSRIDPDKWIFQYVGTLDTPRMLGGAMASGGAVYDFDSDKIATWGHGRSNVPNLARFWERIALHRAEMP